MDDAVGDEDVGEDDLGVVDVDAVVVDEDGDVGAVQSSQRSAVAELGRVAYGAGNNVVRQDLGDVGDGGVGEDRANVLECLVGGSEDGQVRSGVGGFD